MMGIRGRISTTRDQGGRIKIGSGLNTLTLNSTPESAVGREVLVRRVARPRHYENAGRS